MRSGPLSTSCSRTDVGLAEVIHRIRSPGGRALSNAGPPDQDSWLGLLAGGLIDIPIVIFGGLDWATWWPLLLLPPIAITAAVAIRDRDGWTIRMAAMALGMEQRRRWQHGRIPETPASIEKWLADGSAAAASNLDRAAAFTNTGRFAEARAELSAEPPGNDADRVRALRLEAAITGLEDPAGDMDMTAVREAARTLPGDERQYQMLGAAWSAAWLDVMRRRPWRDRFAAIAKEFEPYRVPLRYRFPQATSQLAMPLAIALGGLITFIAIKVFN